MVPGGYGGTTAHRRAGGQRGDGRVLCNGCSRTRSGPEGSSLQRYHLCAADRLAVTAVPTGPEDGPGLARTASRSVAHPASLWQPRVMSDSHAEPGEVADDPADAPAERDAGTRHASSATGRRDAGCEVYTHGHHPSVVRGHSWRTAENSAEYLLDHLRPGQRLLDLGCGPGTITIDLAARVAPGPVVGIDAAAGVINTATANAATSGLTNVVFATGDGYSIDAADACFDVVHAHQVLQHLSDPIAALEEARRVLVPGGLLAVRESDYGAFVWSPDDVRLDRWMQLYHHVTRRNGAQADAGRWLPAWVRQAGFADVRTTSSNWTFADPDSRQWWGSQWQERATASAFAEQAVAYGFSTETELADIAAAFEQWAGDPDAMFVVVHVEVLATAPS